MLIHKDIYTNRNDFRDGGKIMVEYILNHGFSCGYSSGENEQN